VVVVSQIYPGPFDFFNSSRKKKKKKRVAFVHGPNNTSPFPPLGVVWCVGGSSSSIIPAQFLYRTPLCDVKEKLVREKEEKKGPSKLVFDRWNRILISIYATKEKMMMI
jgi:hypothetical protein